MTVTTRPTATGRVIIESDGRSAYYDGALLQGDVIARVSAPAALVERYTDSMGIVHLDRMLADVEYERQAVAEQQRRDGYRPTSDAGLLSVRVLRRSVVQ